MLSHYRCDANSSLVGLVQCEPDPVKRHVLSGPAALVFSRLHPVLNRRRIGHGDADTRHDWIRILRAHPARMESSI